MFSNHSFNALLKTLEEPPPHVKFLLATTDPQKLPVTILSRCLQFSLKRLPAGMMARYLQQVLDQEGIVCEAPALSLIARAGDGSMRDALSLLDQAIAFGSGQVETATVSLMLGSIDRRQVVGLLEALAHHDAAALLRQAAELDEHVPDYAAVLADLLSLLQRVALIQAVPDAPVDEDLDDRAELRSFAERLPPEEVQLFYQIALLGRRDLPLAPDPRSGFEMTLLRMLCFRPAATESVAMSTPARATSSAIASTPSPVLASVPAAPRPNSIDAPRSVLPPPVAPSPASEWGEMVEQLGLTAMARQLAINCVLVERSGDTFRLMLASSHEGLLNKSTEARIQAALEQHLGRPAILKIQVGTVTVTTPAVQQQQQQVARAKTAFEQAVLEPNVQAIQAAFGAQVVDVQLIAPDKTEQL